MSSIGVYAYHRGFSAHLEELANGRRFEVFASNGRKDEIAEAGHDHHLLLDEPEVGHVHDRRFRDADGVSFDYEQSGRHDDDYASGLRRMLRSVESLRSTYPNKPISVYVNPKECVKESYKEHYPESHEQHLENLAAYESLAVTVIIPAYTYVEIEKHGDIEAHGVNKKDVVKLTELLTEDYPGLPYRLAFGVHDTDDDDQIAAFEATVKYLNRHACHDNEGPYILYNVNGDAHASYHFTSEMLDIIEGEYFD